MALYGCSSGGSGNFGATPASAASGDGGLIDDGGHPVPVDSGGPGSQDAAATGDLAPTLAGAGTAYVYLTHTTTSMVDLRSTTLGAAFYQALPSSPTTSCSITTDGACVVTVCVGTTPTAMTPPPAGGGDVTISGPNHSATLHTGSDSSEYQTTQSLYWSGGETLSFSSTGAVVGPFSDTLVVPNQIQVTSPYLPAGTTVPISRASGLTLQWSGGGAGEAVFTVGASYSGGSTGAVCRYPAAQSPQVVPSSVLSKIPSGVASFSASTQSTHDQLIGGWQVTALVYFNAVYDTGAIASGTLQLN
jgi:hypothetical protein